MHSCCHSQAGSGGAISSEHGRQLTISNGSKFEGCWQSSDAGGGGAVAAWDLEESLVIEGGVVFSNNSCRSIDGSGGAVSCLLML